MKVLLFFLLSLSAHAQPIIVGGFGTDGTTLEPNPNVESVYQAAEIFQALEHLQSAPGEKVVISHEVSESEQSVLACEEPDQSLHQFKAGCTLILGTDNRELHENSVEFGGEFAKLLYSALSVEEDNTQAQMITKNVANLTCSISLEESTLNQVTCIMTNLFAEEIEL